MVVSRIGQEDPDLEEGLGRIGELRNHLAAAAAHIGAVDHIVAVDRIVQVGRRTGLLEDLVACQEPC